MNWNPVHKRPPAAEINKENSTMKDWDEKEHEDDIYQQPDGFIYDSNRRMYFNVTPMVNDQGQKCNCITWFNPRTGDFTMDVKVVE